MTNIDKMLGNQNKKRAWRWLIYFIALLILTLTYLSYFAPDMMVTLTNQVWAFCSW